METRANHLAVGSFVLIAVAGLIGFVLWLGKAEIDREFDRYLVNFGGSVTGLTVASTVRYRGVPVGTVKDIRIDPSNSEIVQVIIEITHGTPIKEDAVAILQMQGITGLVDVELEGGSKDSPPLRPARGQKTAIIPSKASAIEELFQGVPELMARATVLIERSTILVDQGTRLLSDENITAITETIDNVQRLTDTGVAIAENIQTLTGDISTIAGDVSLAASEMNILVTELSQRLPGLADDAARTLQSADRTLTTADATLKTVDDSTVALTVDGQAALRQLANVASKLTETANQLNLMVAENRPGLKDFSSDGLYELSRFMVEARDLVASLNRISERLEADPARFIFGDAQSGYTPQ